MGVAQAQTIARVSLLTAPEAAAREGGKVEAAGDVFLDIDGEAASIASYTLTYSVPVVDSTELQELDGYAAADSDLEDGEVAFNNTETGDAVIAITDVTLDVSGADSGPITVTLKMEASTTPDADLALLIGPATMPVITEILPGVKATAKLGTIRTRGGTAEATFTIEPGFTGAFETGQRVEVEVQGLPEAVAIAMEAADAKPPNSDDTDDDPEPRVVMGAATLTGEVDGDDKSVTLTLGVETATDTTMNSGGALSDGVTLTLTLTTDDDDVSLPLTVGEITARVSLVDTAMGTDTFDDAFTSPMVVFEISPAQCTLLFPLVTYIQGDGEVPLFNTGFAITNPAYTKDPASGHIIFTFYKSGIEPAVYATHGGSPGTGLGDDGRLAPGGTYAVNADELLTAANWAELAVGHVHVRTDYTDCNGVGLIYGTMGIDQSYTATVLDNDTGMDN